jgi:DNA-directed RNA polymerase specialized sigma subunit
MKRFKEERRLFRRYYERYGSILAMRDRLILTCRYRNGLTWEEVTQFVPVSPQGAGQIARRALRQMVERSWKDV